MADLAPASVYTFLLMRAAVVLLLPCLLLLAACSEPPQKELDMARGALDAARAAGAEQYANESFAAASAALQQANDAVAQRDYRLALSRALDANERAQEAARNAADGKARARSEAEVAIVAASTALQNFREQVTRAEAAKAPRAELDHAKKRAATAEAALQESRTALKASDYVQARQRVVEIPAALAKEGEALDAALTRKPARPVRRTR